MVLVSCVTLMRSQISAMPRMVPSTVSIRTGKNDSRIDHLFLTKEFEVKKYGILTDTYRSEVKESAQKEQNGNFPKEVSLSKYEARTPSDHFPVMIVVEVKD